MHGTAQGWVVDLFQHANLLCQVFVQAASNYGNAEFTCGIEQDIIALRDDEVL